MAVRSRDLPSNAIDWRRFFAIVAQVASWFTTLWAVQWVWPDGQLAYQVVIAVIAEALLVVLKERLFRGDDPALGWAGFIIDALVNGGGILPKACRVLSFPPVAALTGALGLGACTTYGPASVVLALLGGALLSVLPHRLWRS